MNDTFVPKVPPSKLGFLCKPDLPPHISILFRARPPLKYHPIEIRGIHRNYTGIFDGNQNILSKFNTEKIEKKKKEVSLRDKKIIKSAKFI